MRTDRVVGLDIGSSHVRAAAAEFETGRLTRFAGIGESQSKGVKDGVIVDVEAASSSVAAAIDDLRASAKSFDLRRVVVSISGRQIASLNSIAVTAVTRPSRRIMDEDIMKAVELSKVIVVPPDREILQCVPRSFRVDGQEGVMCPVGMYGNRLEIDAHLVTTTFSHVQNISEVLGRAGLNAVSVVCSSIASSQSVLKTDEKKLGVILIDIGESVSDIAIFQDGSLTYTSVVNVAGGHASSDLRSSLRISAKDAERFKESYGRYSIDGPNDIDEETFTASEVGTDLRKHFTSPEIGPVVEARMESLFHLIRFELIKSGCYGLIPGGAVLTGGGSRLTNIDCIGRKVLKVPVRIGAPRSAGAIPDEALRHQFSTVLGLLLFGGENQTALNQRKPPRLESGLNQVKMFFDRIARAADGR